MSFITWKVFPKHNGSRSWPLRSTMSRWSTEALAYSLLSAYTSHMFLLPYDSPFHSKPDTKNRRHEKEIWKLAVHSNTWCRHVRKWRIKPFCDIPLEVFGLSVRCRRVWIARQVPGIRVLKAKAPSSAFQQRAGEISRVHWNVLVASRLVFLASLA